MTAEKTASVEQVEQNPNYGLEYLLNMGGKEVTTVVSFHLFTFSILFLGDLINPMASTDDLPSNLQLKSSL